MINLEFQELYKCSHCQQIPSTCVCYTNILDYKYYDSENICIESILINSTLSNSNNRN